MERLQSYDSEQVIELGDITEPLDDPAVTDQCSGDDVLPPPRVYRCPDGVDRTIPNLIKVTRMDPPSTSRRVEIDGVPLPWMTAQQDIHVTHKRLGFCEVTITFIAQRVDVETTIPRPHAS